VSRIQKQAALVRECIAERRAQADVFRGRAIGATVTDAECWLRDATVNEATATGMERALDMLLG